MVDDLETVKKTQAEKFVPSQAVVNQWNASRRRYLRVPLLSVPTIFGGFLLSLLLRPLGVAVMLIGGYLTFRLIGRNYRIAKAADDALRAERDAWRSSQRLQ